MVDNAIKTRFLFEINKGSNKNAEIDVNAVVRPEDRRVPFENMIYVADGPSDVPVFSLLRKNGGKAFAVYVPESEAEFAQNDALLQAGRVPRLRPRAATPPPPSRRSGSATPSPAWSNASREERARALAARVTRPPRHLHADSAPSSAADAACAGNPLRRIIMPAPARKRSATLAIRPAKADPSWPSCSRSSPPSWSSR
jgi:hypothetical protein